MKSKNPYVNLKDFKQIQSVQSIENLYNGKLYYMDYVADYKLDKLLDSNITDLASFTAFVESELLGIKSEDKKDRKENIDGGCSSFVVKTPEGHILLCRNFDYKMDMSAVIVRTTPVDGYTSIGLIDTGWINGIDKSPLYGIGSLDDGKTDLSMTISFPYLIMDGMNEKGLAVCVLKLDGAPTNQNTGKNKITTTSAIRLILDKAANVKEAISLLENYDMKSAIPDGNFHFHIADSGGNSIVLEYCKNKMTVLKRNYVTNFYLASMMNGLGHGYDRYNILKAVLSFKEDLSSDLKPFARLTEHESMSLLELVSQEESEESTSMTQWSVIYDLTEYSATFAVRREYENQFTFNKFNM